MSKVGIARFALDSFLQGKSSTKKNTRPVFFFLSAVVNVEGVKATLKIGGLNYVLLNISKIIEDIVSVHIDEN